MDATEPLPPHPAEGADRRLFRRYAAGLAAELVLARSILPCRVSDISLGGACIELESTALTPGITATLRSPAIAGGYSLPVEVRKVLTPRVHLAFQLDEEADHELTMFLMDSPATLDGLEAAAA